MEQLYLRRKYQPTPHECRRRGPERPTVSACLTRSTRVGEVPRHCAGTEQYLTRFLHELIWLISPTNEQRTAVLKSESVKTKSNLCPADYLRPHHGAGGFRAAAQIPDRKSTRLNSSHVRISYAVFCLKKKN